MPDSYIRHPTTGTETTTLDGDFHFAGNVEVAGTLTRNGQAVGGSVSLETPTGVVNGSNDEFVFTAPPIIVFRNGVNESRLGSVTGNTFTFNLPPEVGDDIEGIV